MGTTVYNGQQRLLLASLWFYQDRLHWVSIWGREYGRPELAQRTLH
jgi:hypothetical protein